MEMLPEILNTLSKIAGLLSALYAVVIWLLVFFKRTTMLQSIGSTNIVDTVMCSIFTFIIGMFVFGTSFVVDQKHFNGYSLGSLILGLIFGGVVILYVLDKIGAWRKNLKEI